MKSLMSQKHVMGFPQVGSTTFFSLENAPTRLALCDSSEQYKILGNSCSNNNKTIQRRVDSVIGRMNKIGERVDSLAQGIRDHVKLGPKLTKTVKGKLSLGAKIIQVGGLKKIFKQNFSVIEDEKLLKAFQCYLSTTTGPISGLLFISTEKISFCSEKSIKVPSPSGNFVRVPYKVSIPLGKIKRVNGSEDLLKPSQKYVQVVTYDNFEFWFMGFLNYQKSLRFLQEVIVEVQL
ncbi:hypothetical protein Leryth_001172 [Lithospermum erythrorhizon]|nr:hypothetical protein Leryth_001172 [Lithospermum erythrorhizon]